jgi:hypothetical protein
MNEHYIEFRNIPYNEIDKYLKETNNEEFKEKIVTIFDFVQKIIKDKIFIENNRNKIILESNDSSIKIYSENEYTVIIQVGYAEFIIKYQDYYTVDLEALLDTVIEDYNTIALTLYNLTRIPMQFVI